jgi:hypothetical protein
VGRSLQDTKKNYVQESVESAINISESTLRRPTIESPSRVPTGIKKNTGQGLGPVLIWAMRGSDKFQEEEAKHIPNKSQYKQDNKNLGLSFIFKNPYSIPE